MQIYNSWLRVTCDVDTNLLSIFIHEIKTKTTQFCVDKRRMKGKVIFGIDLNTEMTILLTVNFTKNRIDGMLVSLNDFELDRLRDKIERNHKMNYPNRRVF